MTPTRARLFVSVLAAAALSIAPSETRAHGTLPTCNGITFGPGDGRVFLGTNFGGVLITPGDDPLANDFSCETLVSGSQQSIDEWVWLGSGRVVAIVAQGGFFRGVFASAADRCAYETVAGSDDFLMSDLVADPADPASFYATGHDDTRAVLLHGQPGAEATVVAELAGATSIGVRADASRVVAVFARAGEASIVVRGAETLTTTHALAAGESLRPLAVRGREVWLVRATDTAQELVRSPDAGASWTTAWTATAPITGFALSGASAWVQTGRDGVLRSDGGGAFEELTGSPHGAALALDDRGRLFACGVPWQDDVVVAMAPDGRHFETLFKRFDDIFAAVSCAAGDATATCRDELQFLREYYGFGDPTTFVEGAEATDATDATDAVDATEAVDAVEAGPEDASAEPSEVEPDGAVADPAPKKDGGCGAAGTDLALSGGVVLLGLARARRRLLVVLAAFALGSGAAASRAADGPVIAVLYVDNHTGDPSWNGIEKGFADMLVTDLAAQGLTVVERARLEALIAEQKLQRSAFVDPKSAVKVGQGLGATHVVMGTLTAVSPVLRIDLRLVEVASGKVVVTAKVDGNKDQLFELEQALVGEFVGAFDRTFARSPTPQTKVKDTDALLEYSKAVDLADRGELEAARQRLEQAIKKSPSFVLARVRKDELEKRIAASRERRDDIMAATRELLVAKAKEGLAGAPRGKPTRLGWLTVLQHERALAIAALVTDPRFGVARRGEDKALTAAMKAWAKAQREYVVELDEIRAANKQDPFWDPDVPDDQEKLARDLKWDVRPDKEPARARNALAVFLAVGELRLPVSETLWVAPPLATLDPALEREAWATFGEARRVAGDDELAALNVIEDWGEALLLRKGTDEAVAKWQEALDQFPTAHRYEYFEKRIKGVLGLVHDANTADKARWAEGLATCDDDMDFRVGIDEVVSARVRVFGLAALPAVVADVERACKGKPEEKRLMPYVYSWVGRYYGRHLYCDEFERWMAKAIAAGESPSDVDGWRRNWSQCPLPDGQQR